MAKSRYLAVGDADYPPFSFLDEKKQPAGYDVDAIRSLKLGAPVEIRLMDWNEAKRAVCEGKADILLGLGSTSARLKDFDFARSMLENKLMLFVPRDVFHLTRPEDLLNRRVAIQKGDIAEDYLRRNFPSINLYRYPDQRQALNALRDFKVDAMAGSYYVGHYWLNQKELDKRIKVIGKPLFVTPCGPAVKKGNSAMKALLDRAVADAERGGELRGIRDRWFGESYFGSLEKGQLVFWFHFAAVSTFLILLCCGVILLLKRQIDAAVAQVKAESLRAEREKMRRLEEQAHFEVLRQTAQLKDEFLSVISHELRTPLNAVLGFGSLLEDGVAGELEPRQRLFLAKMMAGSQRMLDLVEDLLDFAGIQAGKLSLAPQEVDYASLIEESVALVEPLILEKSQVFSLDAPAPGKILVDAQRISQVLINLLSNAIKFTPAGGEIRLAAYFSGDRAIAEVTDSGIGIAEEDIPKLFSPFKQLDMGLTRRAKGTGLGLSISKGIVEAHGGDIEATSPGVGRGATFRFSIPVELASAPPA